MCIVHETRKSCAITPTSRNSQDSVEVLLSVTPEATFEDQGRQSPELNEAIDNHNPWKETFTLLMTADLSIVLFSSLLGALDLPAMSSSHSRRPNDSN